MNRVLTLEEVKALPEGARVWIEHSDHCPDEYKDEIYVVHRQYCGSYIALLSTNTGADWDIEKEDDAGSSFGVDYRVWSLPVAPTPDEMAAWPWEGPQ